VRLFAETEEVMKLTDRATASLVAAASICMACVPPAAAQRLTTELLTNEVRLPTWVGAAPEDPDRLFIVERSSGLIRILEKGELLPAPFLDISHNLRALGGGGFMSMAFHPEFLDNRYFYIYFTDSNGDAVVERYTVSGDPNVADPSTRLEIIKVLRNPLDNEHPGGFIGFSPMDGYLYITCGDGGPQGDPDNHAQNRQLLLGKILRIDVDGGTPYSIPPDNPFVDDPNTLDEIWVIGFRNPWRAAFDPLRGDLYVADVGFNRWEELSFIADGDGGRNCGWAIKEGSECHRPRNNCDPNSVLTDPIIEYFHSTSPRRCSIIGGVLYRGEGIPLLGGRFFFADFCSAEVWSIEFDGRRVLSIKNHSEQVRLPNGERFAAISSFGVDHQGEVLVADMGWGIHRIVTVLQLDAPTLRAGRSVEFTVSGAEPDVPVRVFYSLEGLGRTPIGLLDVELALADPRLAGVAHADSNGRAAFTATVPSGARGRTIWLQVAHRGNTSNVVKRVVE